MNFRNPSPPPGYVPVLPLQIVKTENTRIVNGIPCVYYDLLMESGIFNSNISDEEFVIYTSEDEPEAPPAPPVVLKEEPKSPGIEVTLSDDLLQKIKIENDKSPKSKIKEHVTKHKEKKKRKKRERHYSSSSDDSGHKHISRRSSEVGSDYEKKKVKIEKNIKTEKSIKTENMPGFCDNDNYLYGSYYCEICKASMNCHTAYQNHIKGKRHLKTLKLKNTAEMVSKPIAPISVESRYPPAPPGVYRTKTKNIAKIQSIVEELRTPCPGLEKIIEIQGLKETSYYCELCDAPCSAVTIVPHLQGHKHQLRSLKLFEPEIYEDYRYRKKQDIEKKVVNLLKTAENKYGRGLITVEKEFKDKVPEHVLKPISSSSSKRDKLGPSCIDPDDAFPKNYSETTIPDVSKSDFYCKICDSHMNCEQMWDMHIRGKRHLKNTKKAPGEAPSKTRSVLIPHARAKLMDEIDRINEPIVGLDEMRETQNPDGPGEMYNCFLCGACLTYVDVIDHILSQKHKTKYLEKIKHPDILLLKDINIQGNKVSSIIEETCANVEAERGRGHLEVYVIRNSGSTW